MKMTRRKVLTSALCASIGTKALTSTGNAETGVLSENSEFVDVRLVRADIVFRRQFCTALRRLERRGTISKADAHKYRVACYNRIRLATADGESGAFVQLLRKEVDKLRKAAGLDFDDIMVDLSSIFSQVVNWIIENWELVLRVVLMLLVFLEKPAA